VATNTVPITTITPSRPLTMNSISSFPHSGPSSTVASVSDLDGFTIGRDYLTTFNPAEEHNEFGFDPPEEKFSTLGRFDQAYSPPEQNDNLWPGFEREEDLKHPLQSELDKFSRTLPGTNNSISRFGQVTPPRTNSTDSTGSVADTTANSASASPKSAAPNTRRRAKPQTKDSSTSVSTTSSSRKRKSTRKAAAAAVETPSGPDDTKRKASLEKNRLAAAKCRINKKEKTEQLQRDSHDKAVHNAFLKDQVMQMKEEIQQINAMLLTHANCKGCKNPDEIQKHLSHLSTDFMNSHVPVSVSVSAAQSNYGDYPSMTLDEMPPGLDHAQMLNDSYFPALDAELNPPLPDFDRSGEFDVHTPMQTD
jgi:hypothetical protein